MDEKQKLVDEINQLKEKKEIEGLKKERDRLKGKRSILEIIGLVMVCIIVFILCYNVVISIGS